MRMFLLKNLERHRGSSFVRSALQQAPLKDAQWIKQWKETGETGLLRFLGENKLPRHNPFILLPLWEETSQALSGSLTPAGNPQGLEALLRKYAAIPASLHQVKAAFLAALFHEIYLLNVLPEVPAVTRAKVLEVQKWLAESPLLAKMTHKAERSVLLFFAGRKPASTSANDAIEFLN